MIICIQPYKDLPVTVSQDITDDFFHFFVHIMHRSRNLSGCLIDHQIKDLIRCRIIFCQILFFHLGQRHCLLCFPCRHIGKYAAIFFIYQIYIYIRICKLFFNILALLYQCMHLTGCIQQIVVISRKQIHLITCPGILCQCHSVDILNKLLLYLKSVSIQHIRTIVITFHLIGLICFRMSVISGTAIITFTEPVTDIHCLYINRL